MSEFLNSTIADDLSQHELITGPEVPISGFRTTYDQLFNRYALSPYGEHQGRALPRYSNTYAYEPAMMLADLGPDVHPVGHMRYTHDEVHARLMYVQNCLSEGTASRPFTAEEIVAGRLAALLHDTGECEQEDLVAKVGRTVGDIAWNTKSDDDEAAEAAIRQVFYQELYPELPEGMVARIESIILHQEGDEAADAFAVTERIGYYMTAMRAGHLALLETFHRSAGSPERDDHSYEMLKDLAVTVSNNHREVLRERAADYPFAGLVLAEHARLDGAIQEQL
jgi:hypothetical protein